MKRNPKTVTVKASAAALAEFEQHMSGFGLDTQTGLGLMLEAFNRMAKQDEGIVLPLMLSQAVPVNLG